MVPLPFTMWADEHDGVLVARFAGRLDAAWAREVQRTLLRLSPSALCLDFSRLTGIDQPGVAALVAIRQDVVSGGGRFVLRGVGDAVRATLAAAGFDALVDDSLDARDARGPTRPVTQLPLKGGRDGRRSPAGAPKVA